MKSNFPKYSSVPITGRVRSVWEFLTSQDLAGKTLIDIGCSYGWLEWQLKDKKLKRIVALDPNLEAVNYARKNVTGPKYFVSPADNIPVRENIADIAVMFDVIEHVPKNGEIRALKEARRVLKPNGKLLLTTPYSYLLSNVSDPAWYLGHRHYSKEKINELVKKSGFKIENIYVKGNIWTIIYITWFYIMKWVFKVKIPRNELLEKLDDRAYDNKDGYFTLFVEAIKA